MKTMTRINPVERCVRQRLKDVADLLEAMANGTSHGKQSVVRLAVTPTNSEEDASIDTEKVSKSKLIHDLRVACRRGETALCASTGILAATKSNWIRQRMHQIRKLCNPLRDNEIFLKWLEKQATSKPQRKLVKSVSQAIKEEYPPVADRAQKAIQQHRFEQHLQKLSSSDAGADEHAANGLDLSDEHEQNGLVNWRHQLGRWLFHILDGLIHNFPDDHDNFKALHQLRIAAKRLRYGMEFVAEIDSKLKLQEPIQALQDMQEKLGELHDAVVRLERLQAEFNRHRTGNELISVAQEGLESSLADWKNWWQPAIWKRLLKQSIVEVSKLLT
ncbi:MAG: hypothetical protein JWM11_7723 [Planctomycetaceae bacterium]|nr:hypothetical protein [Planctomycetaceae bacterium]